MSHSIPSISQSKGTFLSEEFRSKLHGKHSLRKRKSVQFSHINIYRRVTTTIPNKSGKFRGAKMNKEIPDWGKICMEFCNFSQIYNVSNDISIINFPLNKSLLKS